MNVEARTRSVRSALAEPGDESARRVVRRARKEIMMRLMNAIFFPIGDEFPLVRRVVVSFG